MKPPHHPNESSTVTRRHLFRGIGGVAAVGALAACGSNTGREGAEGGTLSQWYHQYGEPGTKQAVEKYAEAFKGAQVDVQWVPGDYDSKLSSGLLSDKAPDVFESQLNISMVRSNQVEPLDDIMKPVKDDYNPIDIETNTVNGKIYGVPMIGDPQLIYYRKSWLDKAGLAPPETFDDLVEASKALTQKKRKGIYIGNDGGVALGPAMLHSLGLSFLTDDDPPKPGFNDPQFADALGRLHELYDSGNVLQQAPTDWTDPSAFTQQLAGMQWTGLWAMPLIQDELGDDFGVIPLPKINKDSKPAVYASGWTAFVSAKSKNKDKAKEFVKWLWIDKTEYQEDWNLNYGFHIPPRKSLSSKAKKLQQGPAAEAVSFWEKHAITNDPRWTPKMATAFNDMITNVVRKGERPKDEMASASKAVTAELKRLFS